MMKEASDRGSAASLFAVTSWKTVLQARRDDSEGKAALGRLLTRYYGPIQRIIQLQQRCDPDQAADLTQEFVKECLRRDFLREVGPDKGRFRTFIRRCLEYFLRDQHVKTAAQKRGGGEAPLSLHQTDEEGHPLLDPPAPAEAPGTLLDREWARQVVEQALLRLEAECRAARRAELYRELRDQLTGAEEPTSAARTADRLGLSEGAVNVARHRLRQRLGELIAEEVQGTVAEEGDWREELQYLMQLVGK
jgi:RNA polymerase sigma-70 factor (ECF subfamily)